MEITKATRAKARRIRKQLVKIPNDRLGVFMKVIVLAIECGINPWAPSKPQKGKRR